MAVFHPHGTSHLEFRTQQLEDEAYIWIAVSEGKVVAQSSASDNDIFHTAEAAAQAARDFVKEVRGE